MLISKEVASLAKDKRFDVRKLLISDAIMKDGLQYVNQAVLQTWLRDVHKIITTVFPSTNLSKFTSHDLESDIDLENAWQYVVHENGIMVARDDDFYNSYENALELALTDALNLIK